MSEEFEYGEKVVANLGGYKIEGYFLDYTSALRDIGRIGLPTGQEFEVFVDSIHSVPTSNSVNELDEYKNRVAEELLTLHKLGKLTSEDLGKQFFSLDLGKQFFSLNIDRKVPRKYSVNISFEIDSDGPLTNDDVRKMLTPPVPVEGRISLTRLDR